MSGAPLVALALASVFLRTRTIESGEATTPPLESGAWIVASEGPIKGEWRERLERAGARIHGYLPDNAYLVTADEEALKTIETSVPHTILTPYLPADKRVSAGKAPDREFLVIVLDAERRIEVAERIRGIEGCKVLFDTGEIVRARLTPDALDEVAGWKEVAFIDLSVVNESRPMCDRARLPEAMDLESVWPSGMGEPGLTGKGQVVAVADSGLDGGDLETLHEDMRGRVSRVYAIGREGDWSDFIGHGTHICGSVMGNGAKSGGKVRGPAYEATLIMQSLCDEHGGTARPTSLWDLLWQAYREENGLPGARIHCDSWGSGRDDDAEGAELLGVYVEDCREIDRFTFEHPDLLVVFASGNDAVDLDGDGVVDPDSLNSQATAKNVLTVGGAESARPAGVTYGKVVASRYPAEPVFGDDIGKPCDGEHLGMAAFSGRGPCDDGRIKPDVIAPATMICGPKSSVMRRPLKGAYHYKNGTSMAAPLVAGGAALVREWLEAQGTSPDAATLKALLAAGARSLAPGQYGTGEWREIPATVPNAVEGWGMVDLGRSVGRKGRQLRVEDAQVLAEGETATFQLNLEAGENFFAVLAYNDAPALLAAGRQLVNDLDMCVISPSGKRIWSNSLNGPDRLNNLEGVRQVAEESGAYRIEVRAWSIPMPMAETLTQGRHNAIRYSLVYGS